MKKLSFIVIYFLLSISTYAQKKEVMYVSVLGDEPTKCSIVEDKFHEVLCNEYDVRLDQGKGIFSKEIYKELLYQEQGGVLQETMTQFAQKGADYLCVVSYEKIQYGQLYFRAKIFNVGSSILVKTASYISETKHSEMSDIELLQWATLHLIKKLGYAKYVESTLEDIERTRQLIITKQELQANIIKKEKTRCIRRNNAKAFAYSLVPGVGLMMKGRTGEGIGYMLGDVSLVGLGVGMSAYANKLNKIIDNENTSFSQYNKAKRNHATVKSISYCCFGAAAIVYAVNIVRSCVAKPKSGSRLYCTISPINTVSPNLYTSSMSVNLSLTYKF